MARALRSLFGRKEAEKHAKETGFVRRVRKLMPYALVLALVSCLGCGKADWLADIHRAHNKLTKSKIEYKPFHNQLRKPGFAKWLRALLETAVLKLTMPILEAVPASKLCAFEDILIHDGSSFAVKASLRKTFAGRFKKVSPAAVELHVTMSGLENTPHVIQLAADKESERHFLPEPESIAHRLLLGDRALQDKAYFIKVDGADGVFIIRGTKNIKPTVLEARTEAGVRARHLRYLEGGRLSWHRLPRESVDLEIEWRDSKKKDLVYRGRLVVIYKPGRRNKKEYTYLHTNLKREDFTFEDVGNLYRFRWQIELMFKEWKSNSNLHAFDTGIEAIAEGLIWASLLVAVLKRSITHAAELVSKVELSTQRSARSAQHYLVEVISALYRNSKRALVSALEDAFEFLAANARRAHPKRDRRIGRLCAGLQPIATA
jgi:hypothetical protein